MAEPTGTKRWGLARREWWLLLGAFAVAVATVGVGLAIRGDGDETAADDDRASPTTTPVADATATPAATPTTEPDPASTPAPVPSPTPTPESSPAPTPTQADFDPTEVTVLEDGGLVPHLRGDGFGPWDFGSDAEIVLEEAERFGLNVGFDSGWTEKSNLCAESPPDPFRQVLYGDLTLSFTPEGGLVEWSIQSSFSGLEIAFFEVGPGSTVAEVEAAYGSRLDTDGVEPVFPDDPQSETGIFLVDGMTGLTDTVADDGIVDAMWAGSGCTRIFG